MKAQLLFAATLVTLVAACNPKDANTAGTTGPSCEATLEDFQKLDGTVAALYALSPFEESAIDSIELLNRQVAAQLQALLGCAASRELDLAGKLEHLQLSQTPDGRIRNFSWYANNGGTWQMMNCVYQYFPNDTTAKATSVDGLGGAGRFFQLETGQPVYLGFGAEKTCSTCFDEYAQLFSFRADTLHIEPVIAFGGRMGSVLDFDFAEKTKTLHFTVAIDDLNEDLKSEYPTYPIAKLGLSAEELEMLMVGEDALAVVDSLVWDGRAFVQRN